MTGEDARSYAPLAPGVKGRFHHNKPVTDLVSPLLCDVTEIRTYNYRIVEAETAPTTLPEKGWNGSDIYFTERRHEREAAALPAKDATESSNYTELVRAALNAALNER